MKNVGGMDRVLRIVIGLLLVGATALGEIGAWGWIGVVLIATGALGICPAYKLLGLNTCSLKKHRLID